jgi:hypothetical protein
MTASRYHSPTNPIPEAFYGVTASSDKRLILLHCNQSRIHGERRNVDISPTGQTPCASGNMDHAFKTERCYGCRWCWLLAHQVGDQTLENSRLTGDIVIEAQLL